MYCKNCGTPMADDAPYCPACGVPNSAGQSFCGNCGSPANPGHYHCPRCGCPLGFAPEGPQQAPSGGHSQRSRLIAGFLGIFLGALGIHNFYLGYTRRGVIQLGITVLTFGFASVFIYIWALTEAIPIFTGSTATDAYGIPLAG